MYINLLPEQYRVRLLIRRRLRQWMIVWWACAAAASVPGLLRYVEVRQLNRTLAGVTEACAPLRRLERSTSLLDRQAAAAITQAEQLDALAGEHPWRLLQLVADSARRTEGRLQLQRFAFQRKPAVLSAPAANAGGTTQLATVGSLQLQGVTRDDLAVARFVSGLREANFFQQVLLKSSNEVRATGQTLRQYQVECQY